MTRLDEVARDLVAIFEERRLAYAIMGGLAVRIHAIPRPTFDVDFTVAIPRAALSDFYRAAEARGYSIPSAQLAGWVDVVQSLPVVKIQCWLEGKAIDVDVFLAETDFQEEVLRRRQRHQTNGLEAWFVSPEDLILLKLIAGRPKDRVDIADVLFIQGQLDELYLRHWAGRLGVLPALEEALSARSED